MATSIFDRTLTDTELIAYCELAQSEVIALTGAPTSEELGFRRRSVIHGPAMALEVLTLREQVADLMHALGAEDIQKCVVCESWKTRYQHMDNGSVICDACDAECEGRIDIR
jgi:hypothetical protein